MTSRANPSLASAAAGAKDGGGLSGGVIAAIAVLGLGLAAIAGGGLATAAVAAVRPEPPRTSK